MKRGRTPWTKSKNGTKSRADKSAKKKNSFSALEMCRIIDLCQKRGVTEFIANGVELRFGDTPVLPPKRTHAVFRGKRIPEPDHAENDREAHEMDVLRTKEEQVAMLIIEDPEEFERQLVAGELEDFIEDESSDADQSL